MDTVWGWLGYNKTSQTVPETDSTVNKSLPGKTIPSDNHASSETVIQTKVKPVLGETSYKTYFQRFDTWTREKLPLEKDDDLKDKLGRTGMFAGYFTFLYFLMTHPHVTSHLKNKKLYNNSLKLFLLMGK